MAQASSPTDEPAGKTVRKDARLTRLGHDLRNSATILLGILDRLEELRSQCPPLEEVIADLEHTAEQIQKVTQSLSDLGHGRQEGRREATGGR